MDNNVLSIIEPGNEIYIKMIGSDLKNDFIVDEKTYDCSLISINDNFVLKVTMPNEFGTEVVLPLDRLYHITINTQYTVLESEGVITGRYLSEDGFVMIIELKKMFSVINNEVSLGLETELKANISFQNSKELIEGLIMYISLSEIKIYTTKLLNDHIKLDIVFNLENEKMYIMGEVIETLRTRKGYYESHIKIINMNIEQQEKIAKYILSKY